MPIPVGTQLLGYVPKIKAAFEGSLEILCAEGGWAAGNGEESAQPS